MTQHASPSVIKNIVPGVGFRSPPWVHSLFFFFLVRIEFFKPRLEYSYFSAHWKLKYSCDYSKYLIYSGIKYSARCPDVFQIITWLHLVLFYCLTGWLCCLEKGGISRTFSPLWIWLYFTDLQYAKWLYDWLSEWARWTVSRVGGMERYCPLGIARIVLAINFAVVQANAQKFPLAKYFPWQ